MPLPGPLSRLSPVIDRVAPVAERARDEARALAACRRASVVGVDDPRQLPGVLAASRKFGLVGGGLSGAAIRHGDRPAVLDERGTTSFRELDEQSNALARAWQERGLQPGQGVAMLVRNHRGFHQAFFAAMKCGAKAVLMNTEFAGPQLKDVFGREGAHLLVHDDEFARAAEAVEPPLGTVRAWADEGGAGETLEDLMAGQSTAALEAPERQGTFVILTSGTTGTPKGANRQQPKTLTLMGGLVDAVPFRGRERTFLAAPTFHSLGLVHMFLALNSGTTAVMHRRFKPEAVLDAMAEHRVTALVCVPVMLARLLDAYDARDAKPDLSALRIVFVAGSQLGATLARRVMDRWGEVIYNLYGSTEVALATIAGPEHLREAPDTVGPVTLGTHLRIIDEEEHEVPTGTTGRIVVRNVMPFEGYTGGGGKAVVDGMMASGDVGHVDERGWLYIDGRDDAMIVSGGENVFPDEVEDLIASHDSVGDCAVIGVQDEQWGQRLRAYVVPRDGATVDEDELKALVRDNLARYKVPRDIVVIDELPRNATGKVLKRKLAERDD